MEKDSFKRSPKSHTKVQSPYPALQALLPRLAGLSPTREVRPVFRLREEAQQFTDIVWHKSGKYYAINPIWTIDHTDLQNSRIAGWSITEHPC